MRDPNRIDRMLGKLRRYWHAHPDLRLWQLLVKVMWDSLRGRDPFDIEDDELEREIDRALTKEGGR